MKKWHLSTVLLLLIHGIVLLALSVTNGIHHLFDLNLTNVALGVGILFLIAFGLIFYYLKMHPDIEAKYPGYVVYGASYITVSALIMCWGIIELAKPPFATGYLVFGVLFLTFNVIIGLTLIIASYQAKKRE